MALIYEGNNYPLQEETGVIIGIAMEIHRELGHGFLEIVYKDAFEYELRNRKIFYQREKEYVVKYKSIVLPHKFFADFIVFDKVVLEIKAKSAIANEDFAQAINYLKISGCQAGLIINFGESSLKFKRVVLGK